MALPRMNPVPLQVNSGVVLMKRIHARKAAPHSSPSTAPIAAYRTSETRTAEAVVARWIVVIRTPHRCRPTEHPRRRSGPWVLVHDDGLRRSIRNDKRHAGHCRGLSATIDGEVQPDLGRLVDLGRVRVVVRARRRAISWHTRPTCTCAPNDSPAFDRSSPPSCSVTTVPWSSP